MTQEKTESTAALPLTDEDFQDLDLFAGLQEDSAEYRDEQAAFDNRAKISYVDEGNYWLRLYPEVYVNEAGERRMHVMRRFWSYTGLAKGLRRLPAPNDPECPVRKEVARLVDAKVQDAWKYKAKEEAVIKAYIYKSSLPKDHKYIKTETPMFLVLRRKQMLALAGFLADLTPDELRNILNPSKAAPMIKMGYTKGSGGSSSFGFDIKNDKLPALPEDFPSMFKVLLDEKQVATPEEVAKVRKAVSQIISTGQNILDPDDDGADDKPSTSAQRSGAAASMVSEALAESRKTIPIKPENSAGGAPACPAGKIYGKSHEAADADCIVCEHEADCQRLTTSGVGDDVPL